MGWITELLGIEEKAAPAAPRTADQIRAAMIEDAESSAITVNKDTALQVSTALCCARVIAEGLGQVPLKLFREDGTGKKVEARDHPLFDLLARRPNDWQTSFELREQIGLHLAFEGNAYVYINRVMGQVAELYAFEPASVTVERARDLSLSYKVQTAELSATLPASDIWHIKSLSWNGYRANSPIDLARKSLGLSQALETYGTKLFENGAKPSGIISIRPGAQALTSEQREKVLDIWNAQHKGVQNAHRTALMFGDANYQQLGSTANDAQFIESRRFLIEEICRFFRVLPIMVMQSGATSYASVEQMYQAHQQHTLMPLYSRFEQSAECALLTPEEVAQGYSIRLNANAMLRGSTAERTAYYSTMRAIGAMSINEIRDKEDLPRSDDPKADELMPAANLFGNQPAAAQTAPSDNEKADEVAD